MVTTQREIRNVADNSARNVTLTDSVSVTLQQHSGRTLLMNNAGVASTYTLPAATGGGGVYKFVVAAVNTSNYVIACGTGDIFKGTLIGDSTGDAEPGSLVAWPSDASDDDDITLNGTTTGGVAIGDWVEVQDIASGVYFVRGFVTQSGTEATMFS